MAFSIENLSVLAYSSGFTLWLYKGSNDGCTILADPSFFEEAGDILSAGDMVMVSAHNGSRMLSVTLDANGSRTVASI